jgi:hypothetical protein
MEGRMLRATLTFVRRGEDLVTATSLAVLDAPDEDFLARHVARLREVTAAEDALLSRFQHGSAIPKLLDDLRGADEKQFVDTSAGLATRLHDSMEQSTKPAPGVLAIIISGPDGKDPDVTSILKLDAIPELARYLVKAGQVRLNIVRDLLPAPGDLQKGISVPDERGTSEAIVIDRNPSAARYFFNAYELQVSSSPRESEKALSEAIVEGLPRTKRAEAMKFVAALSGPADEIAKQVKDRYPSVEINRKELGGNGGLGGRIRQNKVAAHMLRYRGDGITVIVPYERLDRVTGPQQVAGGWEMRIRFSARPKEETS